MTELMFCICLILMFTAGLVSGYNIHGIIIKRKYYKWKKEHPILTYDQIIEEAKNRVLGGGWKLTIKEEQQ